MNTKELLERRNKVKRKKPEFVFQDAHKRGRLSWTWKRPRGSGSKMRVGRRGYRRAVKIGWGSPSEVKGLTPQGLLPVTVNNVKELEKINPKTDIVVIASDVGVKKRTAIVAAALAKKMPIMNYKEPEKFLEQVKAQFETKKKEKETKKEEREKKKQSAAKEAQKKKDKENKEETEQKKEEKTEEEKKAEEKKEKDKILMTTQ